MTMPANDDQLKDGGDIMPEAISGPVWVIVGGDAICGASRLRDCDGVNRTPEDGNSGSDGVTSPAIWLEPGFIGPLSMEPEIGTEAVMEGAVVKTGPADVAGVPASEMTGAEASVMAGRVCAEDDMG